MTEKFKYSDVKDDIERNRETAFFDADDESIWPVYDTPLYQVGNSFTKTIPSEYLDVINKKIYSTIEEYGEAFKKYVEDTLGPNKNRNAIEFGGPGTNLFSGFNKGFFDKTVGVCLDDIRSDNQIKNSLANNHEILIGDITKTKNENLFLDIKQWLQTEKADLIISRMLSPLDVMGKNDLILERIIRDWYQLLKQNGLMFIQFEYFHEHDDSIEAKLIEEIKPSPVRESEVRIKKWADEIQKRIPEIEIQFGRGVMRLYKKVGAPDELPKLRDLFDSQNQYEKFKI